MSHIIIAKAPSYIKKTPTSKGYIWVKAKKSYNLYDNKLNTGLEAAEAKKALEKEIASFGYQIVTDRGDVRDKN